MGKRYLQRFKEIVKRYWKSRNEDEILFLTAASTSSAEQEKLPKAHFHNTFTMCALEGGSLPLSFKEHSIIMHPGEILIIGRKIPHMVEPLYMDDACKYRSITIDKELSQEGQFRELVRAAQLLRKEADFKIEQRVKMYLYTEDKELQEVINKYKDRLFQDVLVSEFCDQKSPDIQKEIEVGDGKVLVKLTACK